MSYKCHICGLNDVKKQGDICALCGSKPTNGNTTTSAKPRILNNENNMKNQEDSQKNGTKRKILFDGGHALENTDSYGNDMTSEMNSSGSGKFNNKVNPQPAVSDNNSAKRSSEKPISKGVVKNLVVCKQGTTVFTKWFQALFKGIPFLVADEVTTFKVIPDGTSTVLNGVGNAYEQVIVYGKLPSGTIGNGSAVEVYGRRNADNNIVAEFIKNDATGATVSSTGKLSVGAVWVITILLLCLVFGVSRLSGLLF